MGFYNWSQTAASNATADSSVNWAEGQAPSSVNDSARAMMAALAKYRDDNGPNIQTAGTTTAYTLTTNQGFDSAAHLATQELAFFVHATNGASPTLTVDGIGPYPLVVDGSATPVPTGAMAAGAVHTVVFSNTRSQFQLKGYYADPFNMPIGAGMDYWGATVPNGNFAFANGAALSRTTYAALFAIIGTTYGVGDGSTTFNLPNKVERVSVMKSASASLLTSSYFGGNSTVLGAVGGGESDTLVTANLPAYTPAGGIANGTAAASNGKSIVTDSGGISSSSATGGARGQFTDVSAVADVTTLAVTSGAFTGTPQGGLSTPIRTVQPTIVCNYIIRII